MKLRHSKFIFTHFAPYSSQEGLKCFGNGRPAQAARAAFCAAAALAHDRGLTIRAGTHISYLLMN